MSEPVARQPALDFVALILSVVLSPFLCVPYFCTVFARATARSDSEFLLLATLCVVLSIGVPAAYIGWQVHKGNITDIHVRKREQRQGPFRAGMAGLGTLVLVLWLIGGPIRLTQLSGLLFAQSFLFEMISRSWKISMHTSVLAACLAGCMELAGWSSASLLSIIPLCWARHYRGRHTWGQAFGGAALGYGLTIYPLRWLASL
ncbi:MAG: hypothetical protein J0I12_22280 [Candidatus Eremiobacteraeota bacterium]|nr:hypothetical protein [Candidatus Eremiobacteraeota bacterium]